VQPQLALIQAGYRNRFEHPVPEVVQRYRERDIQVRKSPDCGARIRAGSGAAPGECRRDLVHGN